MQELFDVLKIMGIGVLAIAAVILVKIQDITNENPNLDFKQVGRLFMKKATASYLASITILLVYALTHDEWAVAFTGPESNGLVHRILGLQMVMAFFVAGGMQWGIYKFFLKKVDNIMKIWTGSPAPDGHADTSSVSPTINTEGVREPKKD